MKRASAYLAVSEATSQDIESLLQLKTGQIPWCNPGVAESLRLSSDAFGMDRLWKKLKIKYQLPQHFILLAATSRVCSYKNPELVARALGDARLQSVGLVQSGKIARQYLDEILAIEPSLEGRYLAQHFSELELLLLYRYSLAVVLPSRIEGFGLPAIEALANGGRVIISDSRGLKEAGSEAALRCSPNNPKSLADIIYMLKDPLSSRWINPILEKRRIKRLSRLNQDLLGFSLLAQARSLSMPILNS